MRSGIFILLLLALLSACKSGNKTPRQDLPTAGSFHLLAKNELGDKFTVEFSEDGRFLLCKSSLQPDPLVSHYTVKFFVMDAGSGEILFRETVARGEIVWHNAHTIRVSYIQGIIMPDAEIISNTYLYDLVTNKKTTLGSTEKF